MLNLKTDGDLYSIIDLSGLAPGTYKTKLLTICPQNQKSCPQFARASMSGIFHENLTVADVPSVNALWSLGSQHEFVLVGSTAKRLEMLDALSFINT